MLTFRILFVPLFWFALSLACHADKVPVSDEARKLHESSFVMDLHTDTLLIVQHLGYDFGERHWPPFGFMPWMGHVDIPRAKEGGLKAMFLGLVANPLWGDGREQVRASLNAAHEKILNKYPDRIVLVRSADDFTAATAQGKIAVQFLLEGAHGLGDKASEAIPFLDEIYGQGVRAVGLAHFTDNHFSASSATGKPKVPGLSKDGKDIVRHMNEIGMAIDLAHVHPESLRDAIAITTAPVIVSHTGIAALHSVFRNLKDDEIRAVAKTGGVIGVMFSPHWLSKDWHTPVSTVVAHMLHVKKLVGAQHLALGSDYDGFIWLPKGMRDVTELPVLTQAMLDGGFTPDEVRGILGENILRALRVIESRATKRPLAAKRLAK